VRCIQPLCHLSARFVRHAKACPVDGAAYAIAGERLQQVLCNWARRTVMVPEVVSTHALTFAWDANKTDPGTLRLGTRNEEKANGEAA
jgi:hypothetical protein